MKKILVMSASFKGSLSNVEATDIIAAAIREYSPDTEVVKIPVSDGGEGLVDCFLAFAPGKKVFCRTMGPNHRQVDSFYALLDSGAAVIEMAASAGLLLADDKSDPGFTTTYGVGELILDAIGKGVRKLYLGLGGSATNDAGCGIAKALGIRFFDRRGIAFLPTGYTLSEIARIDTLSVPDTVRHTSITCLADVTNPLYGPSGAAYTYAPQKGTPADKLPILDENLRAYADLLKATTGIDPDFSGAGAAGGIPASLKPLFQAEIRPGIKTILDLALDPVLLQDCDLIVTGEGKFDSQSVSGKAISGIVSVANSHRIPVHAFAGRVDWPQTRPLPEGLETVTEISPRTISPQKAMENASTYLYRAAKDFCIAHNR